MEQAKRLPISLSRVGVEHLQLLRLLLSVCLSHSHPVHNTHPIHKELQISLKWPNEITLIITLTSAFYTTTPHYPIKAETGWNL